MIVNTHITRFENDFCRLYRIVFLGRRFLCEKKSVVKELCSYVIFVLRILIVYNVACNGFQIISFFPVFTRKNHFDFCERIRSRQRSDVTPKTGIVIIGLFAVQSIETILTGSRLGQ